MHSSKKHISSLARDRVAPDSPAYDAYVILPHTFFVVHNLIIREGAKKTTILSQTTVPLLLPYHTSLGLYTSYPTQA
jgi:hypothetical protein